MTLAHCNIEQEGRGRPQGQWQSQFSGRMASKQRVCRQAGVHAAAQFVSHILRREMWGAAVPRGPHTLGADAVVGHAAGIGFVRYRGGVALRAIGEWLCMWAMLLCPCPE